MNCLITFEQLLLDLEQHESQIHSSGLPRTWKTRKNPRKEKKMKMSQKIPGSLFNNTYEIRTAIAIPAVGTISVP